ncbi:hypothetical protein [uncultured Pseudacidovorax sp.]|uniref:hypothetical protein n=1 Tax=uncultured Pseudacidovorax sp. TaxID=679313 RepID=UPI0025F6B176|nr:hypothetical protein [uncultured Pseudacidovorax sp.]
MTALLALVPRWLLLALLAAALLVAGVQRAQVLTARADTAAARQALADYRLASEQQAELQREANRGRATGAEVRYVTQTVYRDRTITKIVKELPNAAAPLAACPVPADAVRLLNAAAACAREDRPAACQPDDGVPGTR